LVLIDLRVPRKVEGRHKELLKELSEIEGEMVLEGDGRGFFDRIKELFD
jgi:DnaJ-class molecular chaperone